MESKHWRKFDDVFQAALDCETDRRSAFLDAACAEDAVLRAEVESLLASYEQAGSFTAAPALHDGLRLLEQTESEFAPDTMLGRHIGPYQIVRAIGSGGMGAVYLAARADEAFQKEVAIKIVKPGPDTGLIIRRFYSERQMLASLDHPNITRLLDGGKTEDGLPYFIMEHVEGQPIDQYCDAARLDLKERLRLFRKVCSAVECAHRSLIIHRDIKPANVLVTAAGVPKLLDFGIAKLLNPPAEAVAREMTAPAVRLMTPEYASPEQVRGENVTTVSDVYSLGVLLYQLLTGARPYRLAGNTPAEIERSICDQAPERPSVAAGRVLGRRLRGDLDNIVLMALRKEPQRRYGSVEQFSEDIRRYLDGQPVAARPDTTGYRAIKFIQRNKAWVATAVVFFFMLTGGIAITLWQTHVVRGERDRARLEQAKAARINAFLQEMVGYSGVAGGSPNQKSHDATVADMLDDAAQRVETELADQPEVKAEMLGTIGGTYMTQAKYDLARRYLREAYTFDVQLYGQDAWQTAGVMHSLGDISYLAGDYAAADSWFLKALPIFRRHANDADFEIRMLLAMLSDAAFVKRALGRLDEAEALWREVLTYAPRLPAKYRSQGMAPKTFLAQLYVDRGDIEKADALASEASRELREFGGDRFSLAQSLIDLGNIRRLEQRYGEADSLIQEGTNLYAQAQGGDHPNVAFGLTTLAMSRYDQGRYALAEQEARRALKIVEKLPKGHYYAGARLALGLIVNKTGRSHEAEPLLREALAIRQQKSPRQSNYVAIALGSLGECLFTQKRYAEAEPFLFESYQILTNLHVPQSPVLKEARERLLSLYAARGKPSQLVR
jgi:tetratricopeptide (TPR) repeat protein